MRRLHLVTIPLMNCVVSLLLTQPTRTLCDNKSRSLQALPISLPASEFWCVALTAGSCFGWPFTIQLSLTQGWQRWPVVLFFHASGHPSAELKVAAFYLW